MTAPNVIDANERFREARLAAARTRPAAPVELTVVDSNTRRGMEAAFILAAACDATVGVSDRPEPKEWR